MSDAMVEMPARFEIQPEVKTSARLFAVKVGDLRLELDDSMVGAGDVARPARARSVAIRRIGRCGAHGRMSAHAQVVVRAPDRHVARLFVSARTPRAVGNAGSVTLEIDEHAVAPLVLQPLHRLCEVGVAFVLIVVDITSSVPFLHAAAAQPSNAALSLAWSNPCPFAITKGFLSMRGPNAAIRARPSFSSKQTQSASV